MDIHCELGVSGEGNREYNENQFREKKGKMRLKDLEISSSIEQKHMNAKKRKFSKTLKILIE